MCSLSLSLSFFLSLSLASSLTVSLSYTYTLVHPPCHAFLPFPIILFYLRLILLTIYLSIWTFFIFFDSLFIFSLFVLYLYRYIYPFYISNFTLHISLYFHWQHQIQYKFLNSLSFLIMIIFWFSSAFIMSISFTSMAKREEKKTLRNTRICGNFKPTD